MASGHGHVIRLRAMLMVVSLAGCTSASPSPERHVLPEMYEDQVMIALDDPQANPFTKQVLADHWVSDEEYAESKTWFSRCMFDQGWLAVFYETGTAVGMVIQGVPGGPNDGGSGIGNAVYDACVIPVNPIKEVYWGMKTNPQGLTQDKLVRQCFEEHGVEEGANLSVDEFRALVMNPECTPSTEQAEQCYIKGTGAVYGDADEINALLEQTYQDMTGQPYPG